jgi:hypothetical protein
VAGFVKLEVRMTMNRIAQFSLVPLTMLILSATAALAETPSATLKVGVTVVRPCLVRLGTTALDQSSSLRLVCEGGLARVVQPDTAGRSVGTIDLSSASYPQASSDIPAARSMVVTVNF